MGDGHRKGSEGVCKKLPIAFPGCETVADCFVFPLGGVNIILGIMWLAMLGEVVFTIGQN